MREKNILYFLIICEYSLYYATASLSEHQGVDILYKLNWPGKIDIDFTEPQDNFEYYPITTAKNEKYMCKIPTIKKEQKSTKEPYTGPNPIELLAPLFNRNSCSFKLESYWTYEICHGRYVRQYHEEREGKKVKVQEYYLGTTNKTERLKLSAEYDERAKNPEKKIEIPTRKFDGVRMPYVEIPMTNGTVCDLSENPRTIKLQYICHPRGKHEIVSLDEVSSCQYEAIVVSPLICSHPDYARDTGEDEISCIPTGKSPRRPKALSVLEAESMKLRHQKTMDDKLQKVFAILSVDESSKDGEPRLRVELHSADGLEKKGDDYTSSMLDSSSSRTDVSPVQSFLTGQQCLHGGNGWWKHEFCYGKSVSQYHVEKNGAKTTIPLGKFDKAKHIEWIQAHPNKRPKPLGKRKQISHFYSDGSLCEKTGKSRQTEVTLKCVDNVSSSPSSVSLFLLEPKTCEYILGVESPLICNILEHADENGLISDVHLIDFDSLKTSPAHKFNSNENEESEEKKTVNDEL